MFNRSIRCNSSNRLATLAIRHAFDMPITSSPGAPKTGVLEVLKALGGGVAGVSAGQMHTRPGGHYLRFEDVQQLLRPSRMVLEEGYVRQVAEMLSATSQGPRRNQSYAAFCLDPDTQAINEMLRKNPLRPKANRAQALCS